MQLYTAAKIDSNLKSFEGAAGAFLKARRGGEVTSTADTIPSLSAKVAELLGFVLVHDPVRRPSALELDRNVSETFNDSSAPAAPSDAVPLSASALELRMDMTGSDDDKSDTKSPLGTPSSLSAAKDEIARLRGLLAKKNEPLAEDEYKPAAKPSGAKDEGEASENHTVDNDDNATAAAALREQLRAHVEELRSRDNELARVRLKLEQSV